MNEMHYVIDAMLELQIDVTLFIVFLGFNCRLIALRLMGCWKDEILSIVRLRGFCSMKALILTQYLNLICITYLIATFLLQNLLLF